MSPVRLMTWSYSSATSQFSYYGFCTCALDRRLPPSLPPSPPPPLPPSLLSLPLTAPNNTPAKTTPSRWPRPLSARWAEPRVFPTSPPSSSPRASTYLLTERSRWTSSLPCRDSPRTIRLRCSPVPASPTSSTQHTRSPPPPLPLPPPPPNGGALPHSTPTVPPPPSTLASPPTELSSPDREPPPHSRLPTTDLHSTPRLPQSAFGRARPCRIFARWARVGPPQGVSPAPHPNFRTPHPATNTSSRPPPPARPTTLSPIAPSPPAPLPRSRTSSPHSASRRPPCEPRPPWPSSSSPRPSRPACLSVPPHWPRHRSPLRHRRIVQTGLTCPGSSHCWRPFPADRPFPSAEGVGPWLRYRPRP